MSVENNFKKLITNFNLKIQNGSYSNQLVNKLIASINNSRIVGNNVKKAFNEHFNIVSGTKLMIGGNNNSNNSLDLLIATVSYYLTDINRYDEKLINYAFDIGLDVHSIIILLFLDNISDIQSFCKMNGLTHDKCMTLTTLKKLSALHRVQFNF